MEMSRANHAAFSRMTQIRNGFFHAWFRGATVPADKYLWPGTLKP